MQEKLNALELHEIQKAFGGVTALRGVDFTLRVGEVHAIVGENGAGKSTLIKIIAGVHKPDSGEIILNGEPIRFKSPQDSLARGISVIYQETSLFPDLSVLENIFAGNLPVKGLLKRVDYKQMEKRAREILGIVNLNIDVNLAAYELSIAQRQMVEIAKALSQNAKILIMDEPTAALSHKEVDSLFRLIGKLKEQGVSIIYISHRLEEIYRTADRVTVLRDGTHIKTLSTSEVTSGELISMMVGRKVENLFPKDEHEIGSPLMEVEGYTQAGIIHDVHFKLQKGEILGFAGLVGAGRTELAMLIAGIIRKDSGVLRLDGKIVDIRSYRDALANGIVYVSEDRQKIGLIAAMSIKDNIALPLLSIISHKGIVDRRMEQEIADKYIEKLAIKAPHRNFKVGNLSGGNQQKVSVAKGLASKPKILILDEPTRGVDVGAKSEIHAIINQLSQQGMSIILISSELPELIGMCDNIIVMREGKCVANIPRNEATQEKIIAYAINDVDNKEAV